MRRRVRGVALAAVALATGVGVGVAGSRAAGPTPVPGALPAGFKYVYNDSYTGWPLAPVDQQHPIRGSFLDPRKPSEQGNYHIGIDISTRDDQPEAKAPLGRSHRVYAVEGGVAQIPDETGIGCVNRVVTIGHFQYWHTDSVGTIKDGDKIVAGQQIGWTCKSLWHVHLSELQTVDGQTVYVNPIHAGGKLEPYTDTLPPVIHAIQFRTPAFAGWQITNNTRWAPNAGKQLSVRNLHGFVDVRALIGDPQSFLDFFADLPQLATELHPYKVEIKLTRLPDGKTVLDQIVFQSDVFFEANLPALGLPVIFDYHYAPGTRENTPAAECMDQKYVDPAQPTCKGATWLRLFARQNGADWDTTHYANGAYRLDVTAWDTTGNHTTRSVRVTVRN
jgi:hypothetical protein